MISLVVGLLGGMCLVQWVLLWNRSKEVASLRVRTEIDADLLRDLRRECVLLEERLRNATGAGRLPTSSELFDEPLYCENCQRETA